MPLLRLPLVIALIGACAGASVGAGAWSGDTAAATAAAAPNAHMPRRLQTISPSSLNEILGKIKLDVCSIPGACFRWPTTMPDTPGHDFIVLGSKVDVSYWNIYCDSLKVGRISFSTRQLSDRTVQLLVSLEDIEIKCGLPPNGPIEWKADYLMTPYGTLTVESHKEQHNSLSLTVTISSEGPSFATSLPGLAGVDVLCDATHQGEPEFELDVHVYGQHFSGHVVELFRDPLKDLLLNKLTGGSNSVVCKQLGSIIPDLLADVLGEVNDELEPYMPYLRQPHITEDAMAAERQLLLEIAGGSAGGVPALVNLHTDPLLGLVTLALGKIDNINDLLPQILPVLLPHATMMNGTLTTRDFLGILGANSTIIIGGSGAVEMDVYVKEIRVGGLNTFTRFDLLKLPGDYTVSSAVDLEYLSLEVDICLTVKPNGDVGGPVIVTNHDPILENVTVRSYVSHPAMKIAALIAVRESVYDVLLGDMLLDPVGCVLGQVFRSNVTEANATIGGIAHPTIGGFRYADLGVIFDDISDICFMMYEQVGETLLPWITQAEVRKTLNKLQMSFLDEQRGSCRHHDQDPALTYVDFRSLMFQSINLTQQLRVLLDEDMTAHDINGFIRSLTESSSGIPGVYRYSHMWAVSTELESFPQPTQNNWRAAHPGKPLPEDLRGPGVCMTCSKIGTIEIGMGNLSLSGVDSVADFDILRPIGRTSLANRVDAFRAQLSIDILFRVEGDAKVEGDAIRIDDSFTVHLDVTNITVVLDIMAKIDQNRFFNLRMRDLADLRHLATTLAAVRAATAAVRFGTAEITINCDAPKRCTSPMLAQMAMELAQTQSTPAGISGVTSALNSFLQRVLKTATTDQNVMRQLNLTVAHYADAVDPANPLSTEIARQLRESQNGACDDFDGPMCRVWQSQRQCEANPGYMLQHCRESCGVCGQPAKDEVAFSIQAVLGGVLLVAGICGTLTWCFLKQQGNNGEDSESSEFPLGAAMRASSKEVRLLADEPDSASCGESGYAKVDTDETEDTDAPVDQHESLLCDKQHLRSWQRYGVPAALVVNILVFAFGHWQLGAQVDIDCHLAGDYLRLDRFVEFSLGHSLVDMYHAGTWALLLMVGTFSGVWPYAKSFAMLYCWCARPGQCFTKHMRVKILAAMDYAGTWSLIDLYVLAMFILAFRLHATSPSVEYVPEKFYLFDVVVQPVAGLYGFITGVCLSIVMNYVVLTLSRKTLRSDGELYTPYSTMPRLSGRVTLHAVFEQLRKQELPQWRCRFIDCLVTETRGLFVLAVVSIVMTIVGATRPSFKISVYGLIGAVVDLGNPGSSVNVFSLVNSTMFIGAQADLDEFAGPAGVWFIAAIYGGFCFLVPLAVLVVSCVQLLCPMTLGEQKRVALVSEALRAWSALEVFIVAVYVTTLQLSQVSNMILAQACHHELAGFVNDVVNPMIQFGIVDVSLFDLDPHANECFILEAVHQDGIYVLILAAALSSLTVRWTSSLTERAMKARFEDPSLFEVDDAVSDESPRLPSVSRATATVELEMKEASEIMQPQPEPGPEPETERETRSEQQTGVHLKRGSLR